MSKKEKTDLKYGENLWKNLQAYKRREIKCSPEYERIANLFAKLGESKKIGKKSKDAYELSAYFYQVSEGKVRKKVFTKAFGDRWDKIINFGVEIFRDPTWYEKILFVIYKYPVWFTRIGLLTSALLLVDKLDPKITIIAYALISWFLEWLVTYEKRNAIRITIAAVSVILAIGSSLLVNLLGEKGSWLIFGRKRIPPQSINSSSVSPLEEEKERDASEKHRQQEPAGSDPTEPLGEFKGTSKEIEQIVADLQAELLQQTSDTAGVKFSEKIVIHGLREVLDREGKFDLQYGGAIQGNFPKNSKEFRNAKQKWMKAISLYQEQKIGFRKGDGIIEPGGTTATRLKEDIKTTRLFNFAKRTKPALVQMISELQTDPDLSRAIVPQEEISIIKAIKESLKIGDIVNYAGAVEDGNKKEIKKMIDAINAYQSTFGSADGIIDANGSTYERLKIKVKTELQTNPEKYRVNNQRSSRRRY